MEHYLINQKKIAIEKGKEFLFKIPIRLNMTLSKIIIENANRSNEEELVVSFYLKNIRSEEEQKQISLVTEPFVSSYSISPNSNTPNGEYMLFACTANKNANIEVSILTN